MSKPPSHRAPDPMAGVVDRLLAQLPGLQGYSEQYRPSGALRNGTSTVVVGSASPGAQHGPAQVLGMWVRVLLGLSLAITIDWWPYSRTCGFPLLGYLLAVLCVFLAGTWAAAASWRQRGALAHVISLTLMLYAVILVGSELLPRTGYAVQQATWMCDDLLSSPTMVLSQDPSSRPVSY
jgi:hypothetical protein